jgi:arabinan endo-1,5-alpha-L-arabinosidase
MMNRFLPLAAALTLSAALAAPLAAQEAPDTPQDSRQPADKSKFQNPMVPQDMADPAAKVFDGKLYAYATGQSSIRLSIADGKDLRVFTRPRPIAPVPAWSLGAMWAPDVVRNPNPKAPANERYVMFFSAKVKVGGWTDPKTGIAYPSRQNCLAVAFSSAPDAMFTVLDHPLDPSTCNGSKVPGSSQGNIDPVVFRDPADGAYWLYWGSGHNPLKRQRLAADMKRFMGEREILQSTNPDDENGKVLPFDGTPDLDIPDAGHDPSFQFTDLVEGSWILRHGDFYYYFTSGDDCCNNNLADHYAVVVWRSRNPVGPWERKPSALGVDGTMVRAGPGNTHWESPGHNSTFKDGACNDWIVYHARPAGNDGRRWMLMDRILWDEPGGWPRILTDQAKGAPSVGPMPAPVPLGAKTCAVP